MNDKHIQIITNAKEQLYSVGLAKSMSEKKLKFALIWPSKSIKRIFKSQTPKKIILVHRDKKSYFTQTHFKSWTEDILAVNTAQTRGQKKGHKIQDLEQKLSEFGQEKLFLPSNSTDLLYPLDLQINIQGYMKIQMFRIVEFPMIHFQHYLAKFGKILMLIINGACIKRKEDYLQILKQKLSISDRDKGEQDISCEKQNSSEIIYLKNRAHARVIIQIRLKKNMIQIQINKHLTILQNQILIQQLIITVIAIVINEYQLIIIKITCIFIFLFDFVLGLLNCRKRIILILGVFFFKQLFF